MKRGAIMAIIAMLGISGWTIGQSKPATSSTTPGQAAGQTAAPAGKRPPQAKTQPEVDAYKLAAALTDPAAQEKAACDMVFGAEALRHVLRVLAVPVERLCEVRGAEPLARGAQPEIPIFVAEPENALLAVLSGAPPELALQEHAGAGLGDGPNRRHQPLHDHRGQSQ